MTAVTSPHRQPRFRRATTYRRLIAVAAVVLLVVQFAVHVATASATTPVASYTYDGDGRLATVTNAAGAVATYHYDSVGNVTSITRTTAAAKHNKPEAAAERPRRAIAPPHIASVNPKAPAVGSLVTITGSGFSTDAKADVVRIGSLMATVRSATASRLTVLAPPDGGGTVSVQTPGGTATYHAIATRGAIAKEPNPYASSKPSAHALTASAGITALSGSIETAAGKPLSGISVTVSNAWSSSGTTTTSNKAGQFLLSDLSSGRRTLTIDGTHLTSGLDYGIYSEPVELPEGITTVLPWISYMTPIDITHAATLAAPTTAPITLTTPKIPGLKIIIPVGTTIRDRAGALVHSLSITPLPMSRTPMPWGPGMIPQYFTVQPGDSTVSGPGLEVIYPNTTARRPGEQVSYLAENPSWPGTGWYQYGTGYVSSDGTEIVPSATTRYHVIAPGGYSNDGAPGEGPAPGSQCQCGDPVDLSTGLFIDQTTDISLPDIEGVTLSRTFRQLDDTVRDFGIGGSDSLDLYIDADSEGNYDLVQPDGGIVVYQPTSTTGLYQAVNTPTDYAGSNLTQSDGDPDGPFTLDLRNGTVLNFGNPSFLTSITDRYGNTLNINRAEFSDSSDGGGQIQTVTTPNGRWLSFTYGVCVAGTSTECITQVVDNAGRSVTYAYDAVGHLVKVIDVDGGVTTYTWATCADPVTCTELTSIKDPMGRVTKITYSSTTGYVTQQIEPNSGVWKYSYTVTNGVITKTIVTDPDGEQSSTGTGTNGYTASNTVGYGTALAQTTTSTYFPGTGLLKSTTDPLGRVTSYTYDGLGDPLTVTALAGTTNAATTTYTYESTYDRVASTTDPLGHKTTISYNDAARTETVTDALSRTTVLTFNSHGQTISTKNAAGTSYDSYLDGDLVAVADPAGNVSTTYYDTIGQPLQVTDPDGNTSSYAYDPAGDKLSNTDPLGSTTLFGYDLDGELTSLTDASGNTTRYTYDTLGDVLTRTDPLGKAQTWTYDPDGNILTSTDRDGNKTSYVYDALGRVTVADYGVSGSAAAESDTTTYNVASEPTQVVDSLSGTYSYTYDNLGEILKANLPQGTISYTYNAGGQRTSMTVPGQASTAYGYDADGELTTLTQGGASAKYTYDSAGRLATTTLPNGIVETDAYDSTSNLISTTDQSSTANIGSTDYTYDADGRILTTSGSLASIAMPTAVSSESYNSDDELTELGGTASLTYDADGNLTSDGTNTYSWNALGELTHVMSPNGSYTYTYSPDGQRISTTTAGGTTSDLYDGDNLVQQSIGGIATANYLGAGLGGTVQVEDSAGTATPLTNQLGSTTNLTNGAGVLSTSYTYDPYGNTAVSGSTNPDPEQYADSQSDTSGLDLMGARYYDASIGRFISQDPTGFSSGTDNLYQYAGGDPVNRNDPSGLCGFWCSTFEATVDIGAGILNGATGGIFSIDPPYCGPGLEWAYRLGEVGGFVGSLLLGGEVLDAIGGGLRAAEGVDALADVAAEETDSIAFQSLRTVSSDEARQILVSSGMDEERAQSFVDSFDGDITTRTTSPGESFFRYTDNPNSTGSFLTKSDFASSEEAVNSLALKEYGNNATFKQVVVAIRPSTVLEGGIAGGEPGVIQTIVTDSGSFFFGSGVP